MEGLVGAAPLTCPTCPATKRLTLARLLVVLCALSLFAGDLFRGLHLLTTRHVLCPEHGELIHAGEEAPAQRSGDTQDRAAVAPDGASGHHHDHCGVAATRPREEHGVATAPSPLAGVAPKAVATSAVPQLPRVVRVPVLSYAPKVSPPVRA